MRVDHTRHWIVVAVAALVTVAWYALGWHIVGELRNAGGLEAIANFGIEAAIVAVAVFPIIWRELETIWERILTLYKYKLET